MAKGRKGALGARTQSLLDELEVMRAEPHVLLANLAAGRWEAAGVDAGRIVEEVGWAGLLDRQVSAATTLMKFMWPQIKAVEMSGEVQKTTVFRPWSEAPKPEDPAD